LAERVAMTIKKGHPVLVEGSLVSSTYEQPNGKGKKSKTSKITSWSVRADVVRRLDRGEPEPQAPASSPDASVLSYDTSDQAPSPGGQRSQVLAVPFCSSITSSVLVTGFRPCLIHEFG